MEQEQKVSIPLFIFIPQIILTWCVTLLLTWVQAGDSKLPPHYSMKQMWHVATPLVWTQTKK